MNVSPPAKPRSSAAAARRSTSSAASASNGGWARRNAATSSTPRPPGRYAIRSGAGERGVDLGAMLGQRLGRLVALDEQVVEPARDHEEADERERPVLEVPVVVAVHRVARPGQVHDRDDLVDDREEV